MSKVDFDLQLSSLISSVAHFGGTHGSDLAERLSVAASPLLEWLGYLTNSEMTGVCDELIDGLRSSIVESAGYLALGLVRPTLFAMRNQIDVSLSWLFFKDHRVEWDRLRTAGEGFFLKGGVIAYLEENYPRFRQKHGSLTSARTRKEIDPYKILSAHVHTQSPHTLQNYGDLSTLVCQTKQAEECIQLQDEVSEYIGDIFLSVFGTKWASLPNSIVLAGQTRLGTEKSALVFS